MINSQDIKKGTCIRLDGKLYFCVDFLHVKPGKGNTIMRTTLKDVVKGGQIERRFNIGEKLEDVRVERRPYQFTYTVDVVSDASTDTVLFADMPTKVQLKVTYTEPGIKGDTATNTLKPATVETGAEVRVPLFINEGEVIEINTTDGSYVGRIRE
mgnify:CR=1 FL=1